MPVPQEILKLVERFDSQGEAYQSGKYNEAQIRVEFIDPLFKALGWDIHNEQGYAEAYKDVIHEDAIKIGGATEAPDLCFRIGGARKFFVECKKPSVNIKDDVHPAYQLRRYAWSARLPLSILTDFHELAVYDCRAKPNKNDTAAIGRLMYFTSNQFAEKWDEFAAIFSRESVLKGSFDKYAEGTKGRKGTASVDDAFLEEIERWRDMLARNIAMRNEKLSQRELNFAVQRIIDRIIFLRICEDRGIEPYGRLMTLKNGERAYPRLGEFFQRADERYNSGIFCFTKNKNAGGEPPDELTLTLAIDDKVIKDIVGNLYYPESPYEFSVLPADILGHVYERFLGKVIRLTAGHQAKVEDKPEVRKAGGVYYTPTYIVDYIVKNTVGKLLEGKTPKQAAKLKILDPACGSGSFLLGAYQYLLNWHRDYYVKQIVDAASSRVTKQIVDTASSRVPKRQDAAFTIVLPKYFDPEEPAANLSGNLPHWRQAGATYFVTFRCADSLPQSKLEQWEKEREEWLCRNPEPHSSKQRTEYYEQFVERLQVWLDSGYGACRLADQRAKAIVEEALKFFDGQRYRLGEFAVMPNHVHVLVTPSGEHTLSDILHSWKSFTANKINELFGVAGELWQKESFDHIVRNADQLERIRIYIKENPKRLEASSTTIADAENLKRLEASFTKIVDAASSRVTNLKLPVYQASGGDYRLTTDEKKRILLNNIYGVDIDSQAVEVTKLSLLLKVLEGESQETITKQIELFHQRALPDLGSNIKCGNSLIGPDFYKDRQGELFGEDEMYRINAFDWHAEFPQVFGVTVDAASSRVLKRQDAASTLNGFDAVIGNPPYIRIQTMKEWAPVEVELYKKLYRSAAAGNYDIYVVFVEKALSLLNKSGRTGFILPHKFFNAQYGEALRKIISDGKHLAHVVHFGDQQVFSGATTYACLLFLTKTGASECQVVKVGDLDAWRTDAKGTQGIILAKNITAKEWNFVVGNSAVLFERLAKMPLKLGDISTGIFVGLQTSADTVFLFKDFKVGRKGTIEVTSTELGKSVLMESDILKHVVRSGNIGRYRAMPTALVLFPYDLKGGDARLFTQEEMENRFPLAWEYLNCNRDLLANREHGKFRSSGWYQLYPKNLGLWERPKLMIPYMITELAAYLDRQDDFYFVNVTTGGFGITSDEKAGSLEYLCALLNSRLLDFYFKRITTTFHGGYFAANKQFIELLPIQPIDFADAKDKAQHDEIVRLVNVILDLNRNQGSAKTPDEKTRIARQISATDREIDRLVYELYGLTEEEVKIVEQAGGK